MLCVHVMTVVQVRYTSNGSFCLLSLASYFFSGNGEFIVNSDVFLYWSENDDCCRLLEKRQFAAKLGQRRHGSCHRPRLSLTIILLLSIAANVDDASLGVTGYFSFE